MSDGKESKDRRKLLLDYYRESEEMARNLILVAVALKGLWALSKMGTELMDEEQEDFISVSFCHLIDAARHLKESPSLGAEAGHE